MFGMRGGCSSLQKVTADASNHQALGVSFDTLYLTTDDAMSAQQRAPINELAQSILDQFLDGQPDSKRDRLQRFAAHYLRRIPYTALTRREADSWIRQMQSQLEFMEERAGNDIKVRVFNPTEDTHGYSLKRTVVEVISNDMPFIVDSAAIAIANKHYATHLIIHPVFNVQRDPGGFLMDIYAGTEQPEQTRAESILHFQIDRQSDPVEMARLGELIKCYLEDVTLSVTDWKAILSRAEAAIDELEQVNCPYTSDQVDEAQALLRWMIDNNFTFLGYREYAIQSTDGSYRLQPVIDTGLGILRKPDSIGEVEARLQSLDPKKLSVSGPVVITKTNAKSTVHRNSNMDYIGIMRFDDQGQLVGELRFLGLYTSAAYNCRPWNIPIVRKKVMNVVERSSFRPDSHGGKTMLHIMESLPREELFQATRAELFDIAVNVYDLQERNVTRLMIRKDRFGRYFSCLVFIPRDRFNTETREQIQSILKSELKGQSLDFAVQIDESVLARLHVIVHVDQHQQIEYDVDDIERQVIQAVRSWQDRLKSVLVRKHDEETATQWSNQFAGYFPAAYVEDVTPWVAAFDVENLALLAPDDIRMSLYRPRSQDVGFFRFKIFRYDAPIPLSEVLPYLENLGMTIVNERPYQLHLADGTTCWIQDFDMRLSSGDLDLSRVQEKFQTAFARIIDGSSENDGFNRLILAAMLDWRQVALLRTLCKYLVQTGVNLSQNYMAQTVTKHPVISRLIIELFEARFDPHRDLESDAEATRRANELNHTLTGFINPEDQPEAAALQQALFQARDGAREDQVSAVSNLLNHVVSRVRSLDEDRILRAFIGVIEATVRTNFYQQSEDGQPREYISLKLISAKVPELPRPRPWREIFVYSPRVEGVHLRGGLVSRGGLRWSDRFEDFRTEVLGLMKAQQVKNTMIVPVGAKGGFVVKKPPTVGGREALMAEVVACYRAFINGLLEITDNLIDDKVVPPLSVYRHDEDDPYLVVAADKGTATFSDIANAVAIDHGFWMGDAFASGGSAGYDHKKMGITAKGAWESVKHHFYSMGRDCQKDAFSVVGIGDMSGDVFGNGMLLSTRIQLKAAFNHIHIFLDPEPPIDASYAERERLFALDRSTWEDYDPALISSGGGVWSRDMKAIPISAEVGEWLGIKATEMAPNDLIRLLLKAPVDLLWNGGIGTYVKAVSETDADVGDRSNNAVRVNGSELRCKVVGEGGNLGLTQRGRIEYALAGGRINTDFVDNSAGVNCSDYEVNIKILLNQLIASGQLKAEDRNDLLVRMTDEVSDLVLKNNFLQAQALSVMESMMIDRLGSKAHLINVLEKRGLLDRELEALPTSDVLQDRRRTNKGLARPELATLLSYSKITLYQDLLQSDVPEDVFLADELIRYFPTPLKDQYAADMTQHRLKREIIATAVTNNMINRMGATFPLRMHEDTGESPGQVAKAFTIACEIFPTHDWWQTIDRAQSVSGSDAQSRLTAFMQVWNLIRHITRWLLTHHRDDLDISNLVGLYQDGVRELLRQIPKHLTPGALRRVKSLSKVMLKAGIDKPTSKQLAISEYLKPVLDIIDASRQSEQSLDITAQSYFKLDQTFRFGWLMSTVESLPVSGQWHAHARGGLRYELYRHHRQLTASLLSQYGSGSADQRVRAWRGDHRSQADFFQNMLADMKSSGEMDYAKVSVAVRALDQLVASTRH